MAIEIRSGLPSGAAISAAAPPEAAKAADKPAEVKSSFEPVVFEKPDIKIDAQQMRQNLQQAITHLNELMRDGGRGLNFSIDPALRNPVVFVKNAETGEVIRQIPNEVVVRVAHSIEDLKGLLHNTSV